ncbi:methyl-accepting chemotaxis protein [Clostridium butyricum]|uniref:methyl-accepting chemotaxis protein n=1 Tax=Clostridium butyricum TaxID=1492 RepID=UPI00168B0F56|nr:methyl-accepting chemotaxis protein [Clostridium butyricum]MBS5984389.1 methyl-accepting chemotaxis protein [Clostridium butyricum]MDB2153285.1 methyl-accepting chemotaxis protein [Clostridium butyricum]
MFSSYKKFNKKTFLFFRSRITSSLKNKLILTYVAIAFIPIVIVSSVSFIINKTILTTKVSNLSNNVSIQAKLNIDNYLNEIEDSTSLVFAHDNILTFTPLNPSLSQYDITNTENEIDEYLLSISLLQNFTDFSLIYEDGSTIGKISETTKKIYNMNTLYSELKSTVINNKNKCSWITGKDGDFNKLYYIKQVNNNALMLTSIYTDELDEVFDKLNDGSGSCYTLINNDNFVIYSNNRNLISSEIDTNIYKDLSDKSSQILSSNNELITVNTCDNGWKLISSIPKSYIFREIYLISFVNVIIALVCMIASGIFGSLLAKKICVPIIDIVTKMQKAEKGDLSVKTKITSSDEIGILCNSFNNMINNIGNLLNQTQLTSEIVKNKSSEMKEMSKQTYDISEEVSKAMEDIATGTLKQSNELDNTIFIMGKLAENIDNMMLNISNVTILSMDTKNIGDKSLVLVNELKNKNLNTNKLMSEITSNINALNKSVIEIEQVLELIKSINEQTNLLSLNARIEAARVGENGKGFAVVAEEIRKLADESKKSTDSVSNVIKNVYNNTASTVELIRISEKVFKEQNEAVNFTNDSFINIINSTEKIVSHVKSMDDLINEINCQKEKTLESTNNIKIITETSSANTEQVLAATEEQTASAETLEQNSNQLNDTIQALSYSLNKFTI